MGDFSRLSNFNPNANYKFVRIGADCPVLEIELNEMQQISEQRLQDIVKNFIGDGVKGVGSYAYSNGTLTVSDEEIIIDGIPLKITTLKLPIAEGERAYIQMWLKEVTYQDTLKYMGNVQETRTIENKILDTNIGSETSRRMQMQYDLVKDTNQRSDLNPVNLYIGTITGGKFVLDAPLLKTYTNTKHVQKFLVTQNQTDFHTEGAFRINSNALEVYVDGVLQLIGYDEDYIEVASNLFRFNTPVRAGSEVIARYSNAIQSESRPNTHGSSHNATGDDPIDISDLADRYGVRDKLTKSSQVLKDLGTAIDIAEPLVNNINEGLSDFHSQNDIMQTAITTAQGIKNDLTTQNSNAVSNKNGLDSSINNAKEFIERLDDSQNLPQMREDINSLKNGLQVNQSLAYKGTDLTCENSLEGRTCNVLIKGQTYQNLIDFNKLDKNYYSYSNGIVTNIRYGVDDRTWSIMNNVSDLLKPKTDYTFIVTNLTPNTQFQYGFGADVTTTVFNDVGDIKVLKFTTSDLASVSFKAYKTIDTQTNVQIRIMLLEGDWTNKEVPSSITGIESVGEKENNKISILSRGRNLFNLKNLEVKTPIPSNVIINENEIIANNYTGAWCSIDLYKKLKPNTKYFISYIYDRNDNDGLDYRSVRICLNKSDSNRDICYNGGFKNSKRNIYQNWFFTTDSTGDALFVFYIASNRQANNINVKISEIMLVETDTATEYEPYKEDKKEILLPIDGGLKSLPNGVADTIEQREDGVYLVQRIGLLQVGNANYSTSGNDNRGIILRTQIPNIKQLEKGSYLCNAPNNVGITNAWYFEYWKDWGFPIGINTENMKNQNQSGLEFLVQKSQLPQITDVNAFKKYMKNVEFLYELNNPVETKLDIKDINLETYDGVTYVTCQTNILPEITFSIPSNLGSLVQNNAKNINDIYKLIDEVLIPQITQNALDIDLLKVK